MKTRETIEADIERMVAGHYYSEDYELEWSGKAYYDGLTGPEQELFQGIMIARLSGRPGLADVSVVTRLGVPAFTPHLAALLDREDSSSAMSRALLAVLSHQPDEQAYMAVERFLDSELEGEALTCLARMNFHRALPHLRWAMQKAHLHNFCIHALHEFKQHLGMEALLEAVKKLVEPDADALGPHLAKIMRSKSGAFNPFTAEEIEEVLTVLA